MNDPQLTPESILAFLKSRRSIRRYRPDPVPEAMVEQLLEAGRWAPSATNRQPWRFIVIRDAAIRKEVGQHAAFYFIRWAHVAEAPLIIALCGDAGNRAYHQYLHEDVGLAGAQIMLQATALGLGSCWVGGLDRLAIAAILKLPENVELVGLLTIGFSAEEPPPPVRKPLADLVHYEVYGNRRSDVTATPGRVPGGVLSIALRRLRLPVRF